MTTSCRVTAAVVFLASGCASARELFPALPRHHSGDTFPPALAIAIRGRLERPTLQVIQCSTGEPVGVEQVSVSAVLAVDGEPDAVLCKYRPTEPVNEWHYPAAGEGWCPAVVVGDRYRISATAFGSIGFGGAMWRPDEDAVWTFLGSSCVPATESQQGLMDDGLMLRFRKRNWNGDV